MYYFHKKLKIYKNPKKHVKLVFWVFWVGFFGWVFYCQPCLQDLVQRRRILMTSSAAAGGLGGGSLCGGRHEEEEEEGEGEEVQRVRAWLREYVPPPVARVPSPRGPSARVPSPRGPSARVPSPRGPTARVHSPRGSTARVPSPRGPSAKVPSPRGSKTARVLSQQGLVEGGKDAAGTPAKPGIDSGFLVLCMAIKRFRVPSEHKPSLIVYLWLHIYDFDS